ncbi:MAG: cytochrome c [Verrucomicrobiaceae bacterium]|nr:MAG: cytochrome c [Verrucomicrobiaceae bacterium]
MPAAVSSGSGVREMELPVEAGTYRPGEGGELAQAFCLTCHSADYCETQPPSGEKYWSATVKKMKEKFGAPLPDEVMAPLTRYLTAAYGPNAP